MPRQVSETTLEIRRMAKVIRLRAKMAKAVESHAKACAKHNDRVDKLNLELKLLVDND